MPIITLTSDFGLNMAEVSEVRALLMREFPGYPVVDVTHCIPSEDRYMASWLFKSAWSSFPEGTIHCYFIDIFMGDKPRLVLAEKEGHYFLAPDNGLLWLTFLDSLDNVWLCHQFEGATSVDIWMTEVKKAISLICSGDDHRGQLKLWEMEQVSLQNAPKTAPNGIECSILYIDRYGNLVINITERQFNAMVGNRPFMIKLPGKTEEKTKVKDRLVGEPYVTYEITRHYNEVEEDRLLARFNKLGYLEIAIRYRSAADKLEKKESFDKNVRYRSIIIEVGQTRQL